jgi:hypothetical protein
MDAPIALSQPMPPHDAGRHGETTGRCPSSESKVKRGERIVGLDTELVRGSGSR